VKANKEVIEVLQSSFQYHLLAIETYMGQAGHFARWGYPVLAERARCALKHKKHQLWLLMERLEFFNVAPEYEHDSPEWPRQDYVGILKANLEMEEECVKMDQAAIEVCRGTDSVTSYLFMNQIVAGEKEIEEITSIQKIIDSVGISEYLSEMAWKSGDWKMRHHGKHHDSLYEKNNHSLNK
jgi:bacterioferritin (cytochrome b1)